MQNLNDFQDVLKYLLLKHQCYNTKDIKKVKQTNVHVNSFLLAQCKTTKRGNIRHQLFDQLTRIGHNNNSIFFYFPANTQACKKEEFQSIYKCLEAELNLNMTIDTKNRLSQNEYDVFYDDKNLLFNNSFFLYKQFLQNQRQFMVDVANKGFNQRRSPYFVFSQLLYLSQQKQKCLIFDTPINFCFGKGLNKIAYDIKDDKIYFYDLNKFMKIFGLYNNHMARNILFWCLIIYIYRKNTMNELLIYRATSSTQKNYQENYVDCLNNDITLLESIIIFLKNFRDLSLTFENWKIIKSKFNLRNINNFKDYKFFTEQLVYSEQLKTAVFYDITTLQIKEYFLDSNLNINPFLNTNLWKVLYYNLIPIDFVDFKIFQKKQMFFVTNYYIKSSQEYLYFQCNLDQCYSQQNFVKIQNLFLNKNKPKLIIMKQYFVNKQILFQKEKQIYQLFFFNQKSNLNFNNVLSQIKKNQLLPIHNNSDILCQRNWLEQIQLNIYLQFFLTIKIVSSDTLNNSDEFKMLCNFGQKNLLEEGLIILHFIKHGLFDKTSFLLADSDMFEKPQTGHDRVTDLKEIKKLDEEQFKEYFEEKTGFHHVEIYYPLIQFIKKYKKYEQEKFIQGMWKILQKNTLQCKFFQQENFFNIMLQIFCEIIEIQEDPAYEIWQNLQQILESNYKNIIIMQLITSTLQKSYQGNHQSDLRSLKIDCFISFLNNKFFNVIQSCLCDILLNQLQLQPSSYLQNFFKNLPFMTCKLNSYGCIVKEILYRTILIQLIKEKYPLYEQQFTQQLLTLIKQVQFENSNVFQSIFEIVKILNKSQIKDCSQQNYKTFNKDIKSLKKFTKFVQNQFKQLKITI